MKLIELANKIKMNNPKSLSEINDRKIALIVREALSQIKSDIDKENDGVIKIPQFGRFRILTIEKEEGKVTKRIIFRPLINK